MNKGLQIVLLVLLFLVSGAVGYFLEDILLGDKVVAEAAVEQPVAEPAAARDTVSTVPVILKDAITAPKRAENGTYGFSVQATVESAHQLKYILYKDEACTQELTGNLSGVFTDIPAAAAKTYYLRAQNVATGDFSEVCPVEGFVQLQMYKKITKAELDQMFNVVKEYERVPKDFLSRISGSLKITANGLSQDARQITKIAQIFNNLSVGVWQSVVVEDIRYDAQGRMNVLIIKVNY